ncbi:hypothetical protein C7386_10676 [Agathobaculum butyriciproducens]|uniref:hypothetical protein n=1 Tax=Agathobaculum butyriciproducens TaxID=1628085 RepID=UPI000D5D86FB|nr:hypothetical protein C7386_10676 [Agathobaculum butyriciproducens]
MKLLKSKKNLLLAASVIVWLGTCLLAMHWNTVYDGAIGGFPTYLWVFAPVALIFNIFMNSRPSNPDGRDHSRWAQALLVFLVALMLFIALLSGMNPLYEISFWWIAALIVLSFIGLLIGKCMNHPLQEASLRQSAYTIFLLYLSYAIAQLGMIAVLHPVSVDEIIRTGEAAGGEYMSRIGGSAEHPLGVYFFISPDDGWCYYDVLTGEAAADYHSAYEPA